MPKIQFSKRKIDDLPYTEKGQVIYWDTETPGLGLVVGKKTKTFRLQLDVRDETAKGKYRTVKKTLGRYGTEVTLEQVKARLVGYFDRTTGEMVQGERLKLKASGGTATGENITLKDLVQSYFSTTKRKRDTKERREDSVKRYKRGIENHYGDWLTLTLEQLNGLTPDVVLHKYQQIATGAGPFAARNTSVMLSAILRYGCCTYPAALRANPLSVLTSGYVSIMKKIEPRHDCLQFDPDKHTNDFRVFYDGLKSTTLIQQDMFMFTLYTGMRRGEVEALRWDHVDLEYAEINVPDTKNRNPLRIPVNRQALEILKRRRGIVGESVPWVFAPDAPASNNKCGYSTMRPAKLLKCTGLKITIHGLRRTFTTVGRRLKRFADTSRLTNHVDSTVEGKHYDETNAKDLRETSQLIGDTIQRYMTGSAESNVIQFPVLASVA